MKELSQSHLFIVQEHETQDSEVTCQGHSQRGTQGKSDTDTHSKIKIYDDKRRGNLRHTTQRAYGLALCHGWSLTSKTLKTCREHRSPDQLLLSDKTGTHFREL